MCLGLYDRLRPLDESGFLVPPNDDAKPYVIPKEDTDAPRVSRQREEIAVADAFAKFVASESVCIVRCFLIFLYFSTPTISSAEEEEVREKEGEREKEKGKKER